MKLFFLVMALSYHLAVASQKKERLLVSDTCVATRVVTNSNNGFEMFFDGFLNNAKNPIPIDKAKFWIRAEPISQDKRFLCMERVTYSQATDTIIKDGWGFLRLYNFYIEIKTAEGPRIYKVILKASFYSEEG
jgi:hypothetical protein